ncbi:MAG: cupin domain-containing protein [Candidatus Binatia bacterium]
MIEGVEIYPLEIKRDKRGWLTEILRGRQIGQQEQGFGQLFVTVAYPGKTKGKHYHKHKVEWFCVVSGEGLLFLRDVRTGKERQVPMGEKNMVTVGIPPYVAHAITNPGNTPFHLVIVVSEEFNPEDPDTFPYEFPDLK